MFKYIVNIYKLFLFSNNVENWASSDLHREPWFLTPKYMTESQERQEFKNRLLDWKVDKLDATKYLSKLETLKGKSAQDLKNLRDDLKLPILEALKKWIVLDSLSSVIYINDVVWYKLIEDEAVLRRLEQWENINMKLFNGFLKEFDPKQEHEESLSQIFKNEVVIDPITKASNNFSIISSANADKLPTVKTTEKIIFDSKTFSKLIYNLEKSWLDKKWSQITIENWIVYITSWIDEWVELSNVQNALKKWQHLTKFAINEENYNKYLKNGWLQELIDKKIAQWKKMNNKKD